MRDIITEKSFIKGIEELYNKKIEFILEGDDNIETDIGLEILYDLFHFCIDYLKVNDLEAEIVNAKLLVISHLRLVELNDNRGDDKEIFEKVSNNIFIDLIKCT